MFGVHVIFQIIFRVESFPTEVTVETIVEAALVDVTARDDIQAFTAATNSSPPQFSKNHDDDCPHVSML